MLICYKRKVLLADCQTNVTDVAPLPRERHQWPKLGIFGDFRRTKIPRAHHNLEEAGDAQTLAFWAWCAITLIRWRKRDALKWSHAAAAAVWAHPAGAMYHCTIHHARAHCHARRKHCPPSACPVAWRIMQPNPFPCPGEKKNARPPVPSTAVWRWQRTRDRRHGQTRQVTDDAQGIDDAGRWGAACMQHHGTTTTCNNERTDEWLRRGGPLIWTLQR
jgi:hypothetical protein